MTTISLEVLTSSYGDSCEVWHGLIPNFILIGGIALKVLRLLLILSLDLMYSSLNLFVIESDDNDTAIYFVAFFR